MLDAWVYLSTSPLTHLTVTLVVFLCASMIYRKTKLNPILNPVLLSVICIVLFLKISKTDYATYFEGAQFVHFLLGPTTVALAVPLYRQFERVKRSLFAILISLLIGSTTSVVTAVTIALLFRVENLSLISVAPKSVTAPVAMGISEQLGGLPSLTAVIAIITGITGAIIGPIIMNRMKITDWAARGLAIGTASHGIGTARAIQINELSGAFSGLAMGINALATAILLPLLWSLFF